MTIHNTHFMLPFRDRSEAGHLLAGRLAAYAGCHNAVVLALPRGGVPVAAEIAQALELPLSVFMVRKLGVPEHPELAMGAITAGGRTFIDPGIVNSLHISEAEISMVIEREVRELDSRERRYCRGQQPLDLHQKIVILTDDGVATGSSMILAAQAVREQGAAYVVVAVPVAPPQALFQLRKVADEVVCLAMPEPFEAVGKWYKDFRQVENHEVCETLDRLLQRETAVAS